MSRAGNEDFLSALGRNAKRAFTQQSVGERSGMELLGDVLTGAVFDCMKDEPATTEESSAAPASGDVETTGYEVR